MTSALKYRTALLRCARLMSDELNLLLIPYQLNYSLWLVVYVLNEKTSATSIDLAQYLNVSKPSIAKRIQILDQLNLIEHIKTDDKRQKLLKLNQKGLALYQTCLNAIDHYESKLLKQMDSNALKISHQSLNELLAILEASREGENDE